MKSFITRLVQPQTTPILQPTNINPKDWLALDLDHIDFYSDKENIPHRNAQTQNPPPVKPPGFQLRTCPDRTTEISNGQLTEGQTDKHTRDPKPDRSENTVDSREPTIPTTPNQRSICLFGVLHRFQHCTGHITTGSWKGRGNQYI